MITDLTSTRLAHSRNSRQATPRGLSRRRGAWGLVPRAATERVERCLHPTRRAAPGLSLRVRASASASARPRELTFAVHTHTDAVNTPRGALQARTPCNPSLYMETRLEQKRCATFCIRLVFLDRCSRMFLVNFIAPMFWYYLLFKAC